MMTDMNLKWVEKNQLILSGTQEMVRSGVVLDIGCGIKPQRFITPRVHICCEPYSEYVDHLNKAFGNVDAQTVDYVVVNAGWADAVKLFPENSVDTVFLVDVIEHLHKDEALKLLEKTEAIARRQLVIFTPWGFMPQHHESGIDAWGLKGVDWQEHKSGWIPEDFSGDEWKFIASKDFHDTNSVGEKLKSPFGAFWAIKTKTGSAVTAEKVAGEDRHHVRELELREYENRLNNTRTLIDRMWAVRVSRKIDYVKGMIKTYFLNKFF